jgi:hypothetical protein
MSEEHDSWLSSAFGFDVSAAAQRIEEGATAVAIEAKTAIADVVPSGIDPGTLRNDVPPLFVPPTTPPPFTPPLTPPIVTPPPITPTPTTPSILTEAAELLLGEASADVTAASAATTVAGGVGLAGAVMVGGAAFVVGAAAPFVIGYALQRGEELDQQADPDEQSLPGGVPPDLSPDGGVDPPTSPVTAVDPATGQPVLAPGGQDGGAAEDPNVDDESAEAAGQKRDQRGPPADDLDDGEGKNSDGSVRRKAGKHGQSRGGEAKRSDDAVVERVSNDIGLNEAERRRLHDAISGRNLNRRQILEDALSEFPDKKERIQELLDE